MQINIPALMMMFLLSSLTFLYTWRLKKIKKRWTKKIAPFLAVGSTVGTTYVFSSYRLILHYLSIQVIANTGEEICFWLVFLVGLLLFRHWLGVILGRTGTVWYSDSPWDIKR